MHRVCVACKLRLRLIRFIMYPVLAQSSLARSITYTHGSVTGQGFDACLYPSDSNQKHLLAHLRSFLLLSWRLGSLVSTGENDFREEGDVLRGLAAR